MKTEISVDLSIVKARDPLKALADVRLQWVGGAVTIRRCAVFQKSVGPAWANLPRLAVEKSSKRQFVPLVDLPRELRTRVLDALLAEYRRKSDAQ